MQLRRDRPCPVCGRVTEQQLIPQPQHALATWRCVPGEHDNETYTREDMLKALRPLAPPVPTQIPSTDHLRVFVGDIEVAPQFVRGHAECTGKLPEIGKPLMRQLPHLPLIAYGTVTHIECTPPSTSPGADDKPHSPS